MARSSAETVEEYLAELPQDRRRIVASVREVILRNLPAGYREAMNWGMIAYEVPLDRYPNTYNGQPLMYAALAAQKNSYTLYLMTIYNEGEDWLRTEFERAGKKLDMGKSCVHFRLIDDLPLDVIGKVVASTPVSDYIALYEKSRKKHGR